MFIDVINTNIFLVAYIIINSVFRRFALTRSIKSNHMMFISITQFWCTYRINKFFSIK